MEQNLLKRVFTLDSQRDVYGNQGHFIQFCVDTKGDAIYALIDHYLKVFSISEFPFVNKERIDAVYIKKIDFEAGSGLLAIGGKDWSGSPPLKIFDTRKRKFKWIVSNFSENFLKKSRAVGRKIDTRYECQVISLPIQTVSNLKISPNKDYVLASCCEWTENSRSNSLKKFSLDGDFLAESDVLNTRVFSIHPEGRIIAAASGKTIFLIDSLSLEVVRSKKITSAEIGTMVFGSESQQLLLTSQEGEIVCVNLDLDVLWSMRIDAIPRCATYEVSANCFYIGTNLADILMFDTDGTLVNINRVTESIRDIGFINGGRYIIVGCKNQDFHIFVNESQEATIAGKEWESRLIKYNTSFYTSTHKLQNIRVFNPSTSIRSEYKREIKIHRRHNANLLKIIKDIIRQPIHVQNNVNAIAKAENSSMSETYNTDNHSANIGNFANKMQDNASMQANMYNTERKQNLAEAAAEIQQLLKQLEATNPTTTEIEKLTVVAKASEEIKKDPTLKARVINALKAGGTEAFKEAVDHPLVNILVATIEGWQEA
jgi:hypothetical protein